MISKILNRETQWSLVLTAGGRMTEISMTEVWYEVQEEGPNQQCSALDNFVFLLLILMN